ncbi:TraR/DksA family transcriptional regulator [Niastella yeongjuensis]|uniref:TraR/DksA family transcriptional regulator n=1 Tax=Niastella yeongjuensis TaxID=354355 RepID=UPI0008D815FC|nr:TraR/DksA C4-type zinc finger protein [Niastella yeongjuensis]SEN67738.1 transcriptional regulator, TraR/DksA family [Niastella yeongjuensis]
MATKKKAAKPAKKTIAPKKSARPVVGATKSAAKKIVAKKDVKPAAKKAVKPPVEKKAPIKHAAVAHHEVAAKAHAKPSHAPDTAKPVAKHVDIKEIKDIKKTVEAPVKVEKPEVKVEVKKPEPVIPPPPPKKPEPPKPVKVVIPEIKTKTSRRYEPEFTKSVLDQPENIQTGPTMRYSDAELSEFKDLILKKAEQAKKELTYLQGLITRKDEMGGDENENRYMTMEDGSMSMEREQLAQMASRQINYIDHLEKALMRIENKTYGICRVTGKLIDKARLRAVPHATLSIEAKQMMNK